MKKLALIPLVLTLVICIGVVWFFINSQPVAPVINLVDFKVPSGASASQVGTKLFNEGLIKSSTAFKIYTQFTGASADIQAGDYKISPGYNLFEIVKKLESAPLSTKVTIPEGFTNSEIAAKFAKSLERDQSFVSEFLEIAKNDQGYLFPDTYLVAKNLTPQAIVKLMKTEFEDKTAGLKPTRDQIILASIIEKETKGEAERPTVSGILMNRIRIGMALQVDVAPETYKTVGLPDFPIANPGIVSIKAAVNPEETDYLYYLHDSTGTIHYAKTLEGHNANIRKYLR